jgi:hypothetical protein
VLPMMSMLRTEPVWVVSVMRMRSTCPRASRDRPDTLPIKAPSDVKTAAPRLPAPPVRFLPSQQVDREDASGNVRQTARERGEAAHMPQ